MNGMIKTNKIWNHFNLLSITKKIKIPHKNIDNNLTCSHKRPTK